MRRFSPILLAVLAGCVMRPEGEQHERDRAAAAGANYQQAFGERELPRLAADAPLALWIAHAERSNGGLEAAWHRWIAGLEEVPQASTQDSTAMLGIEHTLNGGSALDRTGLTLASDTMSNLLWPGRLSSRGEAALLRAKVAAAEFDQQRLSLQRRVAEAFHGLALRDEEIRLQQRLRSVLAVNVPSVRARVQAGGAGQSELLGAEVALARVDAELARLVEGRPALVAALRAVAGARDDGVDPRPALAALQPLRDEEQQWLEQALAKNPEVEVRRREHEARLAEVTVQEWMRVPEFAFEGVLMGDGVATVAGVVTLPFLRGTAIEGAVRQAEAEVRAAEAMRRQAGSDAVGLVVAEVAGLKAVEKQAAVLQGELMPRVRQMAEVARATWSAGRGEFGMWAAAVAMEVEVEGMVARLRMEGAVGRARVMEGVGGGPPSPP